MRGSLKAWELPVAVLCIIFGIVGLKSGSDSGVIGVVLGVFIFLFWLFPKVKMAISAKHPGKPAVKKPEPEDTADESDNSDE